MLFAKQALKSTVVGFCYGAVQAGIVCVIIKYVR